jgi:hypothetical protein
MSADRSGRTPRRTTIRRHPSMSDPARMRPPHARCRATPSTRNRTRRGGTRSRTWLAPFALTFSVRQIAAGEQAKPLLHAIECGHLHLASLSKMSRQDSPGGDGPSLESRSSRFAFAACRSCPRCPRVMRFIKGLSRRDYLSVRGTERSLFASTSAVPAARRPLSCARLAPSMAMAGGPGHLSRLSRPSLVGHGLRLRRTWRRRVSLR